MAAEQDQVVDGRTHARPVVGVDQIRSELPAVERAGGHVGAVAGQEAEEDVDGGIGVRLDEVDRVVEPLRERPAHPLQQRGGRHQEQRVTDDGVGAPGRADATEHHAGSHPVAQLVRRGQQVGPTAGKTDHRELVGVEVIGDLAEVGGELHDLLVDVRRRVTRSRSLHRHDA